MPQLAALQTGAAAVAAEAVVLAAAPAAVSVAVAAAAEPDAAAAAGFHAAAAASLAAVAAVVQYAAAVAADAIEQADSAAGAAAADAGQQQTQVEAGGAAAGSSVIAHGLADEAAPVDGAAADHLSGYATADGAAAAVLACAAQVAKQWTAPDQEVGGGDQKGVWTCLIAFRCEREGGWERGHRERAASQQGRSVCERRKLWTGPGRWAHGAVEGRPGEGKGVLEPEGAQQELGLAVHGQTNSCSKHTPGKH